jgi:alkylmercury lyase
MSEPAMAKTPKPPIPELAEVLARAMPTLAPDEQELALALYRQLARGEPVPMSALAGELGVDQAAIADALESWPGVFRAEDGRVIGFWGLAIGEMPHRFRVDGRQLFTWCAWDALFIPELIGQTAEVESRSPTSGEIVRLTVDPDGIREVVPATTVVSMLSPAETFDYRVIMSFCNFVHFFPSAEEGEAWASQHPATFLLSVREAHELGRLVNRDRFDGLPTSSRHEGRGSD